MLALAGLRARPCCRRPGRVSADSKQYLYLDPGGVPRPRAVPLGPQVGAGGVPPPAHRLPVADGPVVLGSSTPLGRARLGGPAALAGHPVARWPRSGPAGSSGGSALSRAGALAGALVYLLTPVPARVHGPDRRCCCCRGRRCRGWSGSPTGPHRDGGLARPGAGSRSSCSPSARSTRRRCVLVGVGPLLWLARRASRTGQRPRRRRRVVGTGRRCSRVGVSLWWIVGAPPRRGATGCPVLQLTENLETVAAHLVAERRAPRPRQLVLLRARTGSATRSTRPRHYLNDRVRGGGHLRPRRPSAVAAGDRWSGGRTEPASWRSCWWAPSCRSARGRSTIRARTRAASPSFSEHVGRAGPAQHRPGRAPGRARAGRAARRGRERAGGRARSDGARPALVGALAARRAAAGGADRAALGAPATAAIRSRRTGPTSPPTSTREGTAHPRPRDPGVELRRLPLGQHRRPDPARAHEPSASCRREVLPHGSPSSVLLLDALDRRLQEGTFEPSALAPVARLLGRR